jgi:hypothetical protein
MERPAASSSRAAAIIAPVAVGTVVGALTAYSQGWLGGGLNSLANSAGPWSVAAFLVARRSRWIGTGALAAAVTLWCAELGYAGATVIRGGSNATSTVVFWLLAGLLAGPPLGVAAVWSSREGTWSAIGFGTLAGVLIGESWYGWTTVADTTDWRYWAAELAVGLAVLVATVWRQPTLRRVTAAAGTAAIVAVVVFAAGRLA